MSSLTQIFRQIQSSNTDEREVLQTIKGLILIDEPKNIKNYILTLQEKWNELGELLYNSSNKLLLVDNKSNVEKYYSPLEVADILGITKDAIHKHINAGNIEKKQVVKGGKILISNTAVDRFVEKHTKYKNLWESRYFV
jgi:excisionase family DNA binding protein